MKYAITMLLVCCWMVRSASAELIITSDTTIDFTHLAFAGSIRIYDEPDSPTTVDIVDGAIIGGNIHVWGNSILNHRAGFTAGVIFGHDNSTINIFGGVVADGEDIRTFDDSVANIYGGRFGDDIQAFDSSTINLYGGTFDKDGTGASLSAIGDGVINVYLRQYEFAEDGFHLSGVLLDGSEFKKVWVGVDPFDLRTARIVLHTIPEPHSLTLAGLAFLVALAVLRHRPSNLICPIQIPRCQGDPS